MKKFFLLCSMLFCLILTGCIVGAGMGDYTIKLTKDYSIIRTSSVSIDIYSNSKCITKNTNPAIINEVAFNENYIIAKQIGLKNKEITNPNSAIIPDESVEYYWIVDLATDSSFGPLSYSEFINKRKDLSIPNDLKLKSINKYEKEY